MAFLMGSIVYNKSETISVKLDLRKCLSQEIFDKTLLVVTVREILIFDALQRPTVEELDEQVEPPHSATERFIDRLLLRCSIDPALTKTKVSSTMQNVMLTLTAGHLLPSFLPDGLPEAFLDGLLQGNPLYLMYSPWSSLLDYPIL